ncbi:unnamed protein product [Effrenium voratum]|nr:unnamed protein product [Effrenium voratum]
MTLLRRATQVGARGARSASTAVVASSQESFAQKTWRWLDVTGYYTKWHSRRAWILDLDPPQRSAAVLVTEYERKLLLWLTWMNFFFLPISVWYWYGQFTHLSSKPPIPLMPEYQYLNGRKRDFSHVGGRWHDCKECRWLEFECKKICFDRLRDEGREIWGLFSLSTGTAYELEGSTANPSSVPSSFSREADLWTGEKEAQEARVAGLRWTSAWWLPVFASSAKKKRNKKKGGASAKLPKESEKPEREPSKLEKPSEPPSKAESAEKSDAGLREEFEDAVQSPSRSKAKREARPEKVLAGTELLQELQSLRSHTEALEARMAERLQARAVVEEEEEEEGAKPNPARRRKKMFV